VNPIIPCSDLNTNAQAANWVQFRPIIGGAQIYLNESEHNGTGTIGFAAMDEYGYTGYVTAEHVVESTEYQIWQPYDDGDDDKAGKATRLTGWFAFSDSAWIPCDTTFNVSPYVYNPTMGINDFTVESYADSEEDDYVYFSGITSGLVGGIILDDNKPVFNWNNILMYHQCIMDAPAYGGDSGAPVFEILEDDSIEIVGLLHGKTDDGYAAFSHISDVASDLDVVPLRVNDIIPVRLIPQGS
jgi:hypothetical protein